MTPVFDSSILIDYLNGVVPAYREITAYSSSRISIVSWIEVMAGAKNVEMERQFQQFLKQFECLSITWEVAAHAADIRRGSRLRLPDAIILATAKAHDTLLVTRNSKDFSVSNPLVRIPYQL